MIKFIGLFLLYLWAILCIVSFFLILAAGIYVYSGGEITIKYDKEGDEK